MNFRENPWRQALTGLLAIYWLAMFVGTHLPRVPRELDLPGGDKSQHLTAYAILAFLIALRQAWTGKPWTIRRSAGVLGLVALYGALDEVTQIPVGRHADVLDWIADISGAILGLALLTLLVSWVHRGAPGSSRP